MVRAPRFGCTTTRRLVRRTSSRLRDAWGRPTWSSWPICYRWTDGLEQSVPYRERAHRLAVETGDQDGAARTALGLVADHIMLLRMTLAGTWLRTASEDTGRR